MEERKLLLIVNRDKLAYVDDGYGDDIEPVREALVETMGEAAVVVVDISDLSDDELAKIKSDTVLLNEKYSELITGDKLQ